MSEELLKTLLEEADDAIERGLEKAQFEAWKDNVFENNKP